MGIVLIAAMTVVLAAFVIYVIASYKIEAGSRNDRKLKAGRSE
jgi:hypothetical protein